MEKLIELLNEREKTVNGVQHPGRCKEHLEYQCHGPRVINKRFGFIKWLVDNDKIDYRKLPYLGEYGMGVDIPTDSIIAILSISDTPIEFLCEILK